MGESDNDSWSVVDEDESMGDRSAAAGASQRLDDRNTGAVLGPPPASLFAYAEYAEQQRAVLAVRSPSSDRIQSHNRTFPSLQLVYVPGTYAAFCCRSRYGSSRRDWAVSFTHVPRHV